MARSFSFNGTSLAAYGLIVSGSDAPDFRQESDSQLIQDMSYSFTPKWPPKQISLRVDVLAADRADLDSKLNSIKYIIRTDAAHELKLDVITDYYWMAKLVNITGSYRGPGLWQGTIMFQADDPMAYDLVEVSSDFNIDADPKTVNETTGGTGFIKPVYTLTAGEVLTDVTIKVENLTTDEELQWDGSLGNGEVLVIDVATWVVTKEGSESMSGVSGKFPQMAPNIANSIKVTGFSNTGTLNITYRNRYL